MSGPPPFFSFRLSIFPPPLVDYTPVEKVLHDFGIEYMERDLTGATIQPDRSRPGAR
ncbi:hypothetical protein GCM10010924_38630 [Rhizobium wenxiniae]|nr:hypothetical protein GCM10010924_38630 [Rhizobium wenxiniae]